MKMRYKKGQEEMVGFAFIIIIVSVIIVVFLSLSVNKRDIEPIKSHEIDSFIGALLQHTSDCRDEGNREFYSVQELIMRCDTSKNCLDSRFTCDVLEDTISEILEESWKNSLIRGYELKIVKEGEENILSFEIGNLTGNVRGGVEFLPQDIDVIFTAYS